MEAKTTFPTEASPEAEPLDHPIAWWLRMLIIFLISFLVIFSNVINLVVLRTTVQIPPISRFCLINLSCADFLLGCVSCAPCVVTSALDRWIYGDVWCQFAGIAHGCSVTVSIWSLALISVDRYLAIVHPLRYHDLMTPRRCQIVVGCFWTVSLLTFMFPLIFEPNFIYYEYDIAQSMCGLYWQDSWFCIVTALYIPVLSGSVLGVTNYRIGRTVIKMKKAESNRRTFGTTARMEPTPGMSPVDKKQRLVFDCGTTVNDVDPDVRRASGNGVSVKQEDVGVENRNKHKDNANAETNNEKSGDMKAVKVLVITAAMYFLAWGPYVITVLITSCFPAVTMPDWLQFVVMWLANSNSFMNVIVYSLMYSSFRKNACRVIAVCFLARYWKTTNAHVHPVV